MSFTYSEHSWGMLASSSSTSSTGSSALEKAWHSSTSSSSFMDTSVDASETGRGSAAAALTWNGATALTFRTPVALPCPLSWRQRFGVKQWCRGRKKKRGQLTQFHIGTHVILYYSIYCITVLQTICRTKKKKFWSLHFLTMQVHGTIVFIIQMHILFCGFATNTRVSPTTVDKFILCFIFGQERWTRFPFKWKLQCTFNKCKASLVIRLIWLFLNTRHICI